MKDEYKKSDFYKESIFFIVLVVVVLSGLLIYTEYTEGPAEAQEYVSEAQADSLNVAWHDSVVAERKRTAPERLRKAVALAFEAQAQTYEVEDDFDFAKGYSRNRTGYEYARENAYKAQEDFSFALRYASEARFHVSRARENKPFTPIHVFYDAGLVRELAYKAEEAFEAEAQAWEAVGEIYAILDTSSSGGY